MTQIIGGNFAAVGQSPTFRIPQHRVGFNISVWGTFVGTVVIERSFDGGTTWLPKWPDAVYSISSTMTFADSEPEDGVAYRLNCTAYSSGPINYRVSQ